MTHFNPNSEEWHAAVAGVREMYNRRDARLKEKGDEPAPAPPADEDAE
ncbi:hypothetical protein [Kitasatospora sp. NPDC058046]